MGDIKMIDRDNMPKLGFGLMRLPKKNKKIDHEMVCSMVDAYMQAGFNYFDTAYVYHEGRSETEIRSALIERYDRDSFMLATKLPGWELKSADDNDRIFDKQLKRTGAGYFDFYLLHSIEDGNIDTYEKYDCFDWAMRKKDEGLIKHPGFSFHGSPKLLERVLDEHPEMEFVQIQLNYIDWDNPVVRSGKLYEILHKRDIPMIIMEPIKGGTLASLKPEFEDRYKAMRPDDSVASWALRFVASLPGVTTILSGMSTIEQMQENISTISDFEPVTDEERLLIKEVTKKLLDIEQIGCTACGYCLDGCPKHISIPDVFRVMNTLTLYENDEFRPKAFYRGIVNAGSGRAEVCIKCKKCESVCPQHLPITDLLSEAAKTLDKSK